jgi:hypothetical protein
MNESVAQRECRRGQLACRAPTTTRCSFPLASCLPRVSKSDGPCRDVFELELDAALSQCRIVVFQRPISGPQRISLSNAFELLSLTLWPAVRIVGLARHILCCERTFTETGHV